MEAYSGFAEVYDELMDNVPYREWADKTVSILKEQGIDSGLVLELGCGTGNITEKLAGAGYDMIGIDLSEDMLSAAMEKRMENGLDILYLHQDMREFELYGTVAAAVCLCDSLNYVLKEKELEQVFRLVNNYLDPKGIFFFDFNKPEEYESELRRHPIVESREDVTMIWENDYDPESCLNTHHLTLFLPIEEDDEILYEKEEEIHVQRGYKPEEIRRAAEKAGLEYIRIWSEESNPCRGYALFREKGKAGEIKNG